jgi:hypothetical protein
MENIILDSTKKLQIKLEANKTTNECDITVSYVDTTGSTLTDGAQESRSNGTTLQDILSAPSSGTMRNALTVTVVNNDTVQHTFYIYKANPVPTPTNYYLVTEQVLAAGASWDSNLSNNLFDMAGTINIAGSDTNPNSASKIGFWDSTYNALRQMKFSELVTWLGTYFGAPTGTTLNGDIAGFRDSFGKSLVDLGSPLAVLNLAVPPVNNGYVLTANGSTWTSAAPTGGGGGGGGGNWTSDSNTWTFSSADSPTFVISVNADMTALITAGTRIKLTQSATVEYFIVTAVGAFSGGATLITVYGGTDYTLANSAITSPNYSYAKAPTGFPLSPAKWTVEVSDSAGYRTQSSPTANTWYNLGTTLSQITIPIGLWRVEYFVTLDGGKSAATAVDMYSTLSTSNNTESDFDFTCYVYNSVGSSTSTMTTVSQVYKAKILSLATKTLYYLNGKTSQTSMVSINFANALSKMSIRAICAYL